MVCTRLVRTGTDNLWPGWGANAWWVRQDVLEELGMSLEDLSTIEGFEQFLEKAKNLLMPP